MVSLLWEYLASLQWWSPFWSKTTFVLIVVFHICLYTHTPNSGITCKSLDHYQLDFRLREQWWSNGAGYGRTQKTERWLLETRAPFWQESYICEDLSFGCFQTGHSDWRSSTWTNHHNLVYLLCIFLFCKISNTNQN